MNDIILRVKQAISKSNLQFSSKPILIGGQECVLWTLKNIEYYYKKYTNRQYHQEAILHENSYRKMNGVVFGGMYEDD